MMFYAMYMFEVTSDVILPITAIRRLDAVLEPSQDASLTMKVQMD